MLISTQVISKVHSLYSSWKDNNEDLTFGQYVCNKLEIRNDRIFQEETGDMTIACEELERMRDNTLTEMVGGILNRTVLFR